MEGVMVYRYRRREGKRSFGMWGLLSGILFMSSFFASYSQYFYLTVADVTKYEIR